MEPQTPSPIARGSVWPPGNGSSSDIDPKLSWKSAIRKLFAVLLSDTQKTHSSSSCCGDRGAVVAVKHTSAMRPRIFALPPPSPSPRRQPQPHELSGSASSPFMGPPRPPIGPHHFSSHVAPTSSVPHSLTPFPHSRSLRPSSSPLCGLGSRIPQSRGTQMYLSGTYFPGFGREKGHPHTVLPLAPFNGPSSPSHWRAPSISYVASTSVTTHWLVPFHSVQVPSLFLLASLQAWFPNNLVPRDSNVPLLYM